MFSFRSLGKLGMTLSQARDDIVGKLGMTLSQARDDMTIVISAQR